MNRLDPYDIVSWVKQAEDESQHELRAAVHTILTAIANEPLLKAQMIIKGGILLAVRYQSSRFTKDIDFSSSLKLSEMKVEEVKERLDVALSQAVERLDYDLDCKVQNCRLNPPNKPGASFPSIELKIGYAAKGTSKHKRLLNLQSPSVVSIDFSLNEIISGLESIDVGEGQTINAYTFPDLVAEKFRSLLQQVIRDRYRRQDVYDLAMLSQLDVSVEEKAAIFKSLILKSESRGIDPHRDSLADPEVQRRAQADYDTLKDEVADLPKFEDAYAAALAFYDSLPWD